MNIEAARSGGAIAAEIDTLTARLEGINAAIAGGWKVTKLAARDPMDAKDIYFIDGPIADDLSAQGLQFVKTLYESRIAALTTQLGAL